MKELDSKEIGAVNGAGIAYDVAYAAGAAFGEAVNSAMEYIYNEPFRRQYARP